MSTTHIINTDLAEIFSTKDKKGYIRTLAWGDEVEVLEITSKHVEVRMTRFEELPDGSIKPVPASGFIKPSAASKIKPQAVVIEKEKKRVLQCDFVDVQQGDACAIETPKNRVILVDGGDNQLFARYLAGRYRQTTPDKPQAIDCIVVTHGDADHFQGLTEIHKSETHRTPWKRLFVQPKRVYHNGLVKRPSAVKEIERLGATETVDGVTIITELEENLLNVPDSKMNKPFLAWKAALKAFEQRGPIQFRRLSKGNDTAFDFLADEDIKIEVLGPILTKVGGVEGLKFLGDPPKGPRIGHEALSLSGTEFKGKSASHTINGHSIVLRLTYGNFSILLSGDLNDEASRILVQAHEAEELNLCSEVFKVPHHGSADFSAAFLQAVSPVISIVSSGDESARKEFIHPRATLIGALGKYSRVTEPLIFVTELVAFFNAEGYIRPEFHKFKNNKPVLVNDQVEINPKAKKRFFAFSRTAFGIVKVRTDGDRLFVYTNSGQADLKEAYAYEMNDQEEPEPVLVRKA
jgi:beta-lactamase superfamily II metal-dependent hydrolase